MLDVVFVALTIAFFALAVAYVTGCARIVGGEPAAGLDIPDDDPTRAEPAPVEAGSMS